jgi:CRP/FNR family transcriptional regulator
LIRPGIFPKGSILFFEGQEPDGIYLLQQGRVKLCMSSSDGRTLVPRIAEPGDVLGLSATVSGTNFETTAETIEACQIDFVRKDRLLALMRRNGELCFQIAQCLGQKCRNSYAQIRAMGLAHSAKEKLAALLLDWSETRTRATEPETHLRLRFTHEEIARMIGTSRETVSRIFADFKTRQIVDSKGTFMVVLNRPALKAMISC